MKKIIIALAAILLTVAILPKFIGGVVATEHQALLQQISQNPAITISKKSFERHWFTGSAHTELTLQLQSSEVADINLIIDENLIFGPIIFSVDGLNFGLSHSTAKIKVKDLIIDEEIENFINDKITISGLLTFSKEVVSRVRIAEISKEVDGNKLVSQAAYGEFTLANDKKLSGNFTWGGLTINSSNENINIGKVSFDLKQNLVAGDYYSGNAISTGYINFLVSAVKVKDLTDQEMLSITNLEMSVNTDVKDDLMTMTFGYHADEINTIGQNFKEANLTLILSDLDIKMLQEFNQFFAQINEQVDEIYLQQHMAEISTMAAKLLEKDPKLKIEDLSVQTAEGKIQSQLELYIDKNTFDPNDLMSGIMATSANANGSAPNAFFVNLGMGAMVDMYVEQGFIVRDNDLLRFAIKYSQGQLTLNGNVIPM